MRSSCSGHHAARTEPLICPTTRPSTPQSRQPWLHQHKATKALAPKLCNFPTACMLPQIPNSPNPATSEFDKAVRSRHRRNRRPPLRNRQTPPRVPLCETCGDRHASRESCCGSSERLHRFTAGHPGPEPHHVSRPWRPAVGLRPRLIPGVTSVTRDLLSRVRYIKPPGQPPAVGRYEGHIR